MLIKGEVICPICKSENILDYSEFGMPLMHDTSCEDCKHTWYRGSYDE